MPVPKRKTSKARRNKRSAGILKPKVGIALCQTCKEVVMPHEVCKGCGYYRGVKVIRTKEERRQEREIAKQVRQHPLEEVSAKQKEQTVDVQEVTEAEKKN
ncbi:50S ribosomal protein L32 [Candidatus Babeliales bacterium]|nr:50S ribosomal protein L32 [Candidatus Babeliales bacterium]